MEGKSIPHGLLKSLRRVNGFDEKAFVEVHESQKQVVSVRFNPEKIDRTHTDIFSGSEKVPWSSSGYYLPSRPSFTLDPLLHAGAYYVQEASSMFLEQCLVQTTDINQPLRILDLCAAPGGKSTLLQSIISEESLLVSNEVIKTRVSVLVENLTKWSGENVIVTNNDPRDFSRLNNFFDVMVVDAPCSGSGLFRRDPDAIDQWSPEVVNACSLRQRRILSDAYDCLKHGGILIYSTCSYSPEEDEEICDWLLSNYDVATLKLDIPETWNIVESVSERHAYGYRFFPDKLRGEGLFIACFRKNNGEDETEMRSRKTKPVLVTNAERKIIMPWLREDLSVNFHYTVNEIYAYPSSLEEELQAIQSNLYIRKSGITIGKLVRGELLPSHDLALSGLVSGKIFTVSLKRDEALQYLRKEDVTLTPGLRGWALVQYDSQNLGWIKMLGNRSNNYYPKEWRILKSGNI